MTNRSLSGALICLLVALLLSSCRGACGDQLKTAPDGATSPVPPSLIELAKADRLAQVFMAAHDVEKECEMMVIDPPTPTTRTPLGSSLAIGVRFVVSRTGTVARVWSEYIKPRWDYEESPRITIPLGECLMRLVSETSWSGFEGAPGVIRFDFAARPSYCREPGKAYLVNPRTTEPDHLAAICGPRGGP
jgi:hypothetical protein